MSAPFSNCRFRECDLPGQCRSEGQCHHPAVAAANAVEPYCHIYEYDHKLFGVHRQFAPTEWNGMRPTRVVAVYAAPVADSAMAKDATPMLNLPPAMTPFGMLVRALRIVAGTTLYDMAKHLGCSSALLSAVEFGRRPLTEAMVASTAGYFSSVGIPDTLHSLNAAAIAASAAKKAPSLSEDGAQEQS